MERPSRQFARSLKSLGSNHVLVSAAGLAIVRRSGIFQPRKPLDKLVGTRVVRIREALQPVIIIRAGNGILGGELAHHLDLHAGGVVLDVPFKTVAIPGSGSADTLFEKGPRRILQLPAGATTMTPDRNGTVIGVGGHGATAESADDGHTQGNPGTQKTPPGSQCPCRAGAVTITRQSR